MITGSIRGGEGRERGDSGKNKTVDNSVNMNSWCFNNICNNNNNNNKCESPRDIQKQKTK